MVESSIKTPGVYINEIPLFPPSVAQVDTAIPAFIGYTKTAVDSNGDDLTLKAKKVKSMLEYEKYFGTAKDETITVELNGDTKDNSVTVSKINTPVIDYKMHYALTMYFNNGGGTCYVVSAGSYTDTIVKGDDSNDLLGSLKSLEKVDEPTLIVFPDAFKLTMADYYFVMNSALDQCKRLGDRFAIIDIYKNGTSDDDDIVKFRSTIRSEKEHVMYGAAYHPWLESLLSFKYSDSGVTISVHNNIGGGSDLSTLKLEDLLTPAHPFNLIYNLIKAEINKIPVLMPPGSSIAGIYVQVDNTRGVWKAPANVNVMNVLKPEIIYNDEDQGDLNVDPTGGKSINAIRAFVGRGILVWGARTLLGNDNEWRYVSVRRLFIMVEESAKKASQPFVFEPNDANTWVKVRAMLENYLTVLWRQGALAGAKPEHAFFVRCGLGQTMTAQDILEGRLIVEIGMAAVRPAEFIILRFMHKMQES